MNMSGKMLKAEYDYFPFISMFYLLFKIFISELMVIVDCIQDKKKKDSKRNSSHFHTLKSPLSIISYLSKRNSSFLSTKYGGGGSLAHSAALSLCSDNQKLDNEKLAHISLR